MILVIAATPPLGSPPTERDIDRARTTSMPGNFTHCTRFKDLSCKISSEGNDRYDCTYREYASQGAWPKKSIVVEKAEGEWRKLDGDTPMCAVMDLDLGPAQAR
jgi:hypothetical protein